MNKLAITIIITILQLFGLGYLYYTYKYQSGQFPADWVVLNLLAILNAGVLIISYFLYFNEKNKMRLWLIPISISVMIILVLLIAYLLMLIDRYK